MGKVFVCFHCDESFTGLIENFPRMAVSSDTNKMGFVLVKLSPSGGRDHFYAFSPQALLSHPPEKYKQTIKSGIAIIAT